MKKNLFFLFFMAGVFSVSQAQTAGEIRNTYQELEVFSDPLATGLTKGVKKKDIAKIKNEAIRAVAEKLVDGTYNTDYRLATYNAILSPRTLGRQLAIGDGYSKYENVTGIYLPVGKHVVLLDGLMEGKTAGLMVPNWERRAPEGIEPTEDPNGWGIHKQDFDLKNGVNIIEVKGYGGLAYISYFSENPATEKPITVHFLDGAVNGVFDIKKHNDTDWNAFIDNAVYPVVDALGEHIQVAYPVEALKKYAYGKGVELISNYDSLVYRQHRIMGLIKYGRVPENKILTRVNYNYYMFRDGDGVAYNGTKPGYAMAMVVDPASVIKGDPCWGFSHEVGHVHQTRPFFNWGGMAEVSNNVYSLYVTTSFGNKSRISEQDNYTKVRESLYGKGVGLLQEPDVFNRLVPFWQLQLYFAGKGNNPDFYPDLFERFRQQAEQEMKQSRRAYDGGYGSRGQNPAIYQLNFVKTACEVAKLDLTDFFDNYGFFYVGTLQYDDYGPYTYEMTQEMVNECKAAIKAMNLPKPQEDISLLRD